MKSKKRFKYHNFFTTAMRKEKKNYNFSTSAEGLRLIGLNALTDNGLWISLLVFRRPGGLHVDDDLVGVCIFGFPALQDHILQFISKNSKFS